MRKIIYILLMSLLFLSNSVKAEINEKLNYEEVYNNLPVLDFYFESREDPLEVYDTKDYSQSPYTLFRTSLILTCKELTFEPNYYLLTPRNFSNYDFIIFKQKGKIIGFIPTYEKVKINPKKIYKEPPAPKVKLHKRPFVVAKKEAIKVFGRFAKPPSPYKSEIETKVTDDGKYFLVWFYQENYLYKMIFKFQKTKS